MERKRLVQSLKFWNFNENPLFKGTYQETTNIVNEEEDKEPITAHIFAEEETGELYYISNSYLIEKAVKMLDESKENLLEIIFKGQDQVKGKPFNRFEIYLLGDTEPQTGKEDKKTK